MEGWKEVVNWWKRDKVGNTQVCFDAEGISVVYSEAFQKLLRLSVSFLPLPPRSQFLESYAESRSSPQEGQVQQQGQMNAGVMLQ